MKIASRVLKNVVLLLLCCFGIQHVEGSNNNDKQINVAKHTRGNVGNLRRRQLASKVVSSNNNNKAEYFNNVNEIRLLQRKMPGKRKRRRKNKNGENNGKRKRRNKRKNRRNKNKNAEPVNADDPVVIVTTALRDYLLHRGTELDNPKSYQTCAIQRTAEQIGIETMKTEKIVQYYSLYCIFCATSGRTNDLIGRPTDEGVPPWHTTTKWVENNVDPCDGWHGITCNGQGNITKIDLFDNQLSGVWPEEVILLACDGQTLTGAGRLEYIDLFDNPSLFDNFKQDWVPLLGSCLKSLFYGETGFAAPMPILPSGIREYDNSFTHMTGPLSDANFRNAQDAVFLRLDGNFYDSKIPPIIGELPHLEEFICIDAAVSGDLSFMENMKAIKYAWIHLNPGITGQLPAFLGNLDTLESLDVSDCSLKGPLPVELSRLASTLKSFYVLGNELTGKIPTEYGLLRRLQEFQCEDNLLSGVMPEEICARATGFFPTIEILGADCAVPNPDNPRVPCSCCTCCDRTSCGD